MTGFDLILPVLGLFVGIYLMAKMRIVIYDLADDLALPLHWAKVLIRWVVLLVVLMTTCVLGALIAFVTLSIIRAFYA